MDSAGRSHRLYRLVRTFDFVFGAAGAAVGLVVEVLFGGPLDAALQLPLSGFHEGLVLVSR